MTDLGKKPVVVLILRNYKIATTKRKKMYDVKTNFCSPNYKIATAPYSKTVLQNRRRWRDVEYNYSSSDFCITLNKIVLL